MKTIFNGSGGDNTANAIAYLKQFPDAIQNKKIFLADLYMVILLGGNQSRVRPGFVCRFTDRDYPIYSKYLSQHVGSPLQPTSGKGIFFPQRIERSGIESKVGFDVATMNVEIFFSDSLDSTNDAGIQLTGAAQEELSVPPYRDAFTMQSDRLTVLETMKQASWNGELDQAYFFVYRAFMPTPGDADSIGVMQLFTGTIKEVRASRLSVKFQVGALTDMLTTTQTPTQLIENGDRSGQLFIPVSTIPQLSCTVQPGSTRTILIGDGGPPPDVVTANGEPHQIPSVGTPIVIVDHGGGGFVSNIKVVDSDTGDLYVETHSGTVEPMHYKVAFGGTYLFNAAQAERGVLIFYTYTQSAGDTFANGYVVYSYGTYAVRPDDSPVIRQIYSNSFDSGTGLNTFVLIEPLPIDPRSSALPDPDTFKAYQPSSLAGDQSAGPGFPYVPKPESAL